MKRLHIHLAVENLADSIRFYSTLFAVPPTVTKSDYAKWMLDDPRVNFAISTRGGKPGVDHLGLQVESRDELTEIGARLKAAEKPTRDQEATTCCYARSSKTWSADPQGVAWETFYSYGESTLYGEGDISGEGAQMCEIKPTNDGRACCA